MIFARGTLMQLCERESLPYTPLSDYRDALAQLRAGLAVHSPAEALT